jgi:hypothetical protein
LYGRTPGEALERYRDVLSRVFSCCWNHTYLVADRKAADQDPTKVHGLILARGEGVPLGGGQVALRFAQAFTFDRDQAARATTQWHLTIRGYTYALEVADMTEAEIVVWHWDPAARAQAPREPVITPHVHIGTAELAPARLARKHHIPSERVAVEDVIWFALAELEAEPHRDDWKTVLQQTRADFVSARTWPPAGRGQSA